MNEGNQNGERLASDSRASISGDLEEALVHSAKEERKREWLRAALLFVLTFYATTLAGVEFAVPYSKTLVYNYGFYGALLAGMKFSVPLMLILTAHEFGHFCTGQYYGISSSPPFFIPMPLVSPFGTMGAFITMRNKIPTKKALFDIGAAGPYAGFVIALACLIYGVFLSRVEDFSQYGSNPVIVEGDSLLYIIIKRAVHGSAIGGANDILTHPIAFAGWFGMLVTALNLLPVGQLDGGHISYALLGRRAHSIARLIYQAFWAFGIIGLLNMLLSEIGVIHKIEILDSLSGWLAWAILLKIMGITHPPVEDESEELDLPRRFFAWAAFIILILTFIPIPLRMVEGNALSM